MNVWRFGGCLWVARLGRTNGRAVSESRRAMSACIIVIFACLRHVDLSSENQTATKVSMVGMTENVAVGNGPPRINPRAGLWLASNHHRVSIEWLIRPAFAFDPALMRLDRGRLSE